MNAVEIEQAITDLAAAPFDAAEFPYAFLEAFGNKATTLKKLRTGASNGSDVPGGVLQRSNIHIATCPAGEVDATLQALRANPKTTAAKAKFILATDGADFQAEELATGETVACQYADFPNHFGLFLPLAGITTVKQIRESTFDIRATSRLNKLYVELLKDNPDWAAAERRADMNHFMARLIFCFFAEDTDIFNGQGLFTATVDRMSERDSSNTHEVISTIFKAMDTPTRHEGKLDDRYRKAAGTPRWADVFPYVNGQLFSGSTDVPRFSRIARSYLIQIGNLDWQKINPDIFGSMIQAVADDDERSALGMHYTSVPNILKVLNPLFLDDLRAALEEAGDNPRKLLNLRNRMARIRVFDPACGSGNFLVIAYKQMREIEAVINVRRGEPDRKSVIPATNFRGIELRPFPAEIARLALIIAEFQCDVLYRGQKEALAEFLPLDSQNWITCGNALRLDWLSLCPPTGTGVKVQADDLFGTPLNQTEIDFENEGGETYICGNPPYLGSKWQSVEQKEDLARVFDGRVKSWKSLDYVAGWFMKAADYGLHTPTVSALVSTNSICQGAQVPILWQPILQSGNKIVFAHTSFKWANLASHNAGVTVVIVGVSNQDCPEKSIFSISDNGETVVRRTSVINSYLIPADDTFVMAISKPADDRANMQFGNHTYYGVDLLLTQGEAASIQNEWPEAKKLLRDFLGSKEIISGLARKCLWIEDDQVDQAMRIPPIAERLRKVAAARAKMTSDASARKLAETPHRFRDCFLGDDHIIVMPAISSENRPYLPVSVVDGSQIIGHKAYALYDAPLWNMALIASRLHWVWIGTVCVRMRTDFSYSNTLGWNTFPVPKLTEQNKADLTRCAEDILLAREAHFPATIADLYDPDTMPENLRHAHDRNDEVLERIYIGRRFKNDTERLEKLFDLYTKMTGGPK
ncbi:DNA methyltransferase [Novosphingobium sp. Fuku2-ISO-50]|uniref:class I SAM-dependent DNA methyltransferase n=1 Tax=Novosphingobium sp. Fuku2-ISO-50 TaxID=1739114 RepID=UPI00076D010B|nr:DNA methyltransferase [Novosphingobium sp. Fuku2-ISO-50]KUR74219.1 lactate dehydrogenase [Novosphingobium sp. Fuku2-ISO-50]